MFFRQNSVYIVCLATAIFNIWENVSSHDTSHSAAIIARSAISKQYVYNIKPKNCVLCCVPVCIKELIGGCAITKWKLNWEIPGISSS